MYLRGTEGGADIVLYERMHPICRAGSLSRNIMQETNTSPCNFKFSSSPLKN